MVRRQKGVHGTYIYRPPGTAVPASDDQSGISDIQGKINGGHLEIRRVQ